MHPNLYLNHVVPETVTLPNLTADLPSGWKLLDSNILGEFGIAEVLKQFTNQYRADELSPLWDGDRYGIYEKKETKDGKETLNDMLIFRVHARNDADAARLFGGFSQAYDKKYQKHDNPLRRPNFYSFDSDSGGVFLRCFDTDCISMEGGDRALFDAFVRALGWPANPEAPGGTTAPGTIKTRTLRPVAILRQPVQPEMRP
jgi:hypothetical protein